MIFLSVMRTKIIEYCINCFFSKLQNSFDTDKILTPGKKISKIINSRGKGNKIHQNCIIKRVEPVKFMGESINVVFYHEQSDPFMTYSALEKDLEIFY
jgi:hypothetical protein